MATYFFDSSAIIKGYVRETGTAWVNGILDPASGNRIYVASITGVEVTSALARQGKGSGLSPSDMANAIALFQHDFVNQYLVAEIISAVINRAMMLAQTYALRGYDAVQLATALQVNIHRLTFGLPALSLISADAALNMAAAAEGLKVDDPNTHPYL